MIVINVKHFSIEAAVLERVKRLLPFIHNISNIKNIIRELSSKHFGRPKRVKMNITKQKNVFRIYNRQFETCISF
ncbi:hypothetical protein APP77_00130 [Salmonella enterica subsp. enterica serovar Give]|nr:hypothetical protein APP77_00130 [Salmonella enterica subsp. enterica serovar Give]OIW76530.1 hypothetical protein APP76_00130 [Salmonella enterica subsp. enterica serovar Oranienburg]OIX12374.1 hypothetical protein APP67_17025 [Salmonella enterica subsp. enterica serovar Oranienburg]